MSDSHNLQRFVTAQSADFERALKELLRGRKQSHWIWYVFPQIAGLGYSSTAQKYSIQSREEAIAYLNHKILSERILQCCATLLKHEGKDIYDIMGFPDNLKLCSSMTLFALVSEPDSIFRKLLDVFYFGRLDEKTVTILQGNQRESRTNRR